MSASDWSDCITTAGSAEKCDACRKLGADVAVNYKTDDFVTATKAATGDKVISSFGASIGSAPDAIPTRLARGEKFDLVLAMEVVEHVADVPLFVRSCGDMVKPGGMMIAATLNRTLKSFALAIVGAEYILRWLPPGTHQWDKFVTPNELEIAMEQAGLSVTDERGVVYNPLADAWRLSSDTDVNYMLAAEKA